MSLKSEKVKSGYTELDNSEREEVRKFIKDYEDATIEKRKLFSEGVNKTINKANAGPISSFGCPCCGK